MTVNARALLISGKTLGTDPLVDTIITKPESTEAALYASALALNRSPLKKQFVEASLLATADIGAISAVLEIPEPVLEIYARIFYDVASLDKLSKMELIMVPDKAESLLKLWAISQGLEFIAWRLGKPVQVNPVDGLQDLFTTCMYKAKEAMFNPNTSEASKESTKYVKLAMDLARLLKVWVMDSSAAKHDIEMALRTINPEFRSLDDVYAEEENAANDTSDSDGSDILGSMISSIPSTEIDTSVSISDLLKNNEDDK